MMRLITLALLAVLLASCTTLALETPSGVLLDRMTQATVRVETRGAFGSGVLVDRRMVLTVGHVFNTPLDTARVTFENGGSIAGERIFMSHRPDVALIRLDRDAPFPSVAVACGRLSLDAPVIVIGHPGPMRWFVGHGYVASTHRALGVPFDQLVLSVSTIPGASGGPVFDRHGRLRGLIRAGLSRNGILMTGFTLAVPASAFCAIPSVRKQISRATGT